MAPLYRIGPLLLLALSANAWSEEPPAAAAATATPVVEAQSHLEERLTQLEQQVRSQPLLELLGRIDALQQENQQLRGELEEQGHQLKELQQRVADSYRDLDRRMVQLERTGAANAATGTGATQPAPETPADTAERDAYQKAFDLLRELRYDQAGEAFGAFLKSYPSGRYAPMAQYWFAETFYARRNFERAVAEYQALLKSYPDNTKQPEALLKIGYSQLELKKKAEAQQSFEALMQRFPQSPEAQQAQSALKRLGETPAPKGR